MKLNDVLTPCLMCEATGTRPGYEEEDCRSCHGSGYHLTGRAEDVRALLEREEHGRERMAPRTGEGDLYREIM